MSRRGFTRRVGGGEWPSGTAPVIYNASAPPGYAIVTALDEHSIRLSDGVTVAGGTAGGTNDFSTQFATLAEENVPGVGGHALTTAELATHAHGSNLVRFQAGSGISNSFGSGAANVAGNTDNAGSGDAHYHSIDLRVKWAACIVVQKL